MLNRVRKRLRRVFGDLIEFREAAGKDQIFEIGDFQEGKRRVTDDRDNSVHLIDDSGFEASFEAIVRNRVAEMADGRVFIHAGVVGISGRALVLPGRSHTGKSTLVEALVRHGAEYFSDEFAILDESALVHRFPKPITLRTGDGKGRIEVEPPKSFPRAEISPVPCGMVFITEFKKDAEWKPLELSAAEGMLAIIENTVPIRTFTEFSLKVLNKLALRAIIRQSYRSEADHVAVKLIEHFNRSVPDVPLN